MQQTGRSGEGPVRHANRRTKRRGLLTLAITAGATVACVVAALAVGFGGWWIFAMAMAGVVVGLAVGVLIPAAIEDGEVQDAERAAHGYREGRAERYADDGPLPQ
jgi:zinc transporter ZupT